MKKIIVSLMLLGSYAQGAVTKEQMSKAIITSDRLSSAQYEERSAKYSRYDIGHYPFPLATHKLCKEMSVDFDADIRRYYVDKCLYPDILHLFSLDKVDAVRIAVASYLEDSQDLRRLAHDPNPEVIVWIAYNKKTPLDVIKRLANYPDLRVKEMALNNLHNEEEKE